MTWGYEENDPGCGIKLSKVNCCFNCDHLEGMFDGEGHCKYFNYIQSDDICEMHPNAVSVDKPNLPGGKE